MPITIETQNGAGFTIQCNTVTGNNRPVGATATRSGVANVSTAAPKIGNGSLRLNGSSSLLINPSLNKKITDTPQSTVEMWAKLTTTAVQCFVGGGNASPQLWSLLLTSGNRIQLAVQGGTFFSSANAFLPNNTWNHIAWTRDGNDNKIYVNGNLVRSFTVSSNVAMNIANVAPRITVGASGDNTQRVTGNIDEFRISNTLRYTSNFTPQSNAFVSDDSTFCLFHMDGTEGQITFTDDTIGPITQGISFININ